MFRGARRGKSRTSIYRRNMIRLRQYKTLYPHDVYFKNFPSHFAERWVPSSSTVNVEMSCDTVESSSTTPSNAILSRDSIQRSQHDIECCDEVAALEQLQSVSLMEQGAHNDVEIEGQNDGNNHNNDEILGGDLVAENDGSLVSVDCLNERDANNVTEEDGDTSEGNDGDTDRDDGEDDSSSTTSSADDQNRLFLRTSAIPNFPATTKEHITSKDYFLSIIVISIKNNSTYKMTLDILRWINCTQKSGWLPGTKKALWKALSRDNAIISRHLYCQKCREYVSQGQVPTQLCPCGAVVPNRKSKNVNYFLDINLRAQILQFLAIPNIANALKYRSTRTKNNPDAIEDIYDGEEYSRLASSGNFLSNPDNYSLTFNTDGCKVSNSSNASAWPVYLQINELPPHMRKKYMLLSGIFVDCQHPLMSNLLRPFISQARDLHERGVIWKPTETTQVTSKFIVIIASVDSPARPLITRTTQFNGKFGCSFCYAPGIWDTGRRIYPVMQSFGKLRTDAELRKDMLLAFETGNSVFGVKGVSPLIALPEFNVSKGVVVESMHAVFLGVAKQHTKLMLEESLKPFYIGAPVTQQLIDQRLISIRPPACRSRLSRSITQFKKWKASEWRNWLDYAPSCLEGLTDKKFVNHIALLSQAIHILNNSSIKLDELTTAERLLSTYVRQFATYFGTRNMSFNVHLMTHIVDTVRNWGPLWVHSAFLFESWNKKIIDKVTSAHARPDQIATRFLMTKFIASVTVDESISVETKNYISQVMRILEENQNRGVSDEFHGLGKAELRVPSESEKELLVATGFHIPHFTSFHKSKIHGIEYRCESAKMTKHCNSTIYSPVIGFGRITAIVYFPYANRNMHCLFVKKAEILGSAFNTQYIKKVEMSNNIFLVEDIGAISPALTISTSEDTYAVKLSNCWETD